MPDTAGVALNVLVELKVALRVDVELWLSVGLTVTVLDCVVVGEAVLVLVEDRVMVLLLVSE